jgi:electron transfer flavoprotein alpha subunit
MNTGVFIEHKQGKVKKSSLEVLTLSRKSGQKIMAVVFAEDASPLTEELKNYGPEIIVQVKGLPSDNTPPEKYALEISKVIRENEIKTFIMAYTSFGRDLLPRIAAELEAPMLSDCLDVDFATGIGSKPLYAGKVLSQIKLTGACLLYSIRPNSISAEKVTAPGNPELKIVSSTTSELLSKITEVVKSVSKKIDLTEAQIIVSAGRGIGSRENFKIIEALAAELGAAVGASRAAVDSGYADQDMQVGQTGKTVNPVLYIACGISGAIQHLAGMKTAKVIVAINKNPEEPIFKKADYGIVGDLFEIVPLLAAELKKVIQK